MSGQPESLRDLCARLEAATEASWRATIDNGRLQVAAADLQRLFAVFRAYGGRSDWTASEQNIAMLAAPVRDYITVLQGELTRLQQANLRFMAAPEALPAEAEALINPVASIVDYASFVIASGMDSTEARRGRRAARHTARQILQMLVRRKCLIDFGGTAEARAGANQR